MPSHIWCDRANYVVSQSPEEIASLIDDPTRDPRYRESRFIRVDRLFWSAQLKQWQPLGRVMLRIGAISAIEPEHPDLP